MLQKRMIPVVTALMVAMAVWFLTPAAASENDHHDGQMQYVIVIDASEKADSGEVCAAVCDTVLSVLPEKDAQIGVIAYGYSEYAEDEYSYTSVERPRKDAEYIHQLLPLSRVDSVDGQMLHESIRQAFLADEKTSPHGQALLAGVDMLDAAGAPTGEGCIIWLSDGIMSSNEWETEQKCRKDAIDIALQNQWQIRAVHLNYGNGTEDSDRAAEELLKEIAESTITRGDDALQYQKVDMHTALYEGTQNESSVWTLQEALLQILLGSRWHEETGNDKVTVPCAVQNLTYEYVVAFVGKDLEAVSVEAPGGEKKTYAASEDDGDIAVARSKNCFVVRLRFPVPELWTINAYGAGEKVYVYRSIHRAVDIDLVVEDEMTKSLSAGDARNMELGRGGKLFFISGYAYQGHPLDIDPEDHSVTAKLEIQVKRPGENSLYRKLDTIEMKLVGSKHRTENGVAMTDLVHRELELYDVKMRAYRARVVLEWEDEGLRHQYGEWFPFGLQDVPSQQISEEKIAYSVTANGLTSFSLDDHIRNEDGDSLEYELIPIKGQADKFEITDKNGEPVEKVLNDVWIKACGYEGQHEFVLWLWDGNLCHAIPIEATVKRYPDPNPGHEDGTVIELGLDDLPFGLSGLRSWFDFGGNNTVHSETLGKEVLDVCVVGEDAEKVTWSYDEETRGLRIQPTVDGPINLELQIKCDAFVLDENGEYTNQVYVRSMKINATSQLAQAKKECGMWLLLVCFLLLVYAVLCLVLVSIRRFPENMSCTMELQELVKEKEVRPVSIVLSRQVAAFGPHKRRFLDGFKEKMHGISVEELIRGLKNDGEEISDDKKLPGKSEIQNWFDNNGDILKYKQLKKVCLKGTYSPKKTYRISGLHRCDDVVKVGEYKQGSEKADELKGFGRRIPVSNELEITVLTKTPRTINVEKQNQKVGNATEEPEFETKEVRKIVIMIKPKP